MDEIPAEFWQGVEQFNQGEYYACHDTLEAIWMEASQSEKNFYQGILQVAVALYHLSNQNWRGCVILMGEGLNRLRAYQPSYAELDVDTFFQQTAELHQYLQQLGPDQVGQAIAQLNLGNPGTQSSASASESSSAIQLPVLQKQTF